MSLLGVDLRSALRYPVEREDWERTVGIGGVLVLGSVLLVPAVLVVGYLVRVLRGAIAGDGVPPDFDDGRGLAVDGARGSAVVAGYVAAFLAVTLLLLLLVAQAGADGGSDPTLSAADVAVLLLVGLNVGVGLLGLYAIPAAVALADDRDAVRAGFAVGTLRSVLATRSYLGAWLGVTVVLLGTTVVASVVAVVPIVGALVAPFPWFYGATVAAHLLGVGLRDAMAGAEATATGGETTGASLRRRASRLRGRLADRVRGVSSAAVGVADAVRGGPQIGRSNPVDGGGTDEPPGGDGGDGGGGAAEDPGDPPDAATVGAVAGRPTASLDAEDVAALVAALDGDDPDAVATAARTLGEVAAERPGLIDGAEARPRLRDLRLADEPRVREAATVAVRRFSDAGLY